MIQCLSCNKKASIAIATKRNRGCCGLPQYTVTKLKLAVSNRQINCCALSLII